MSILDFFRPEEDEFFDKFFAQVTRQGHLSNWDEEALHLVSDLPNFESDAGFSIYQDQYDQELDDENYEDDEDTYYIEEEDSYYYYDNEYEDAYGDEDDIEEEEDEINTDDEDDHFSKPSESYPSYRLPTDPIWPSLKRSSSLMNISQMQEANSGAIDIINSGVPALNSESSQDCDEYENMKSSETCPPRTISETFYSDKFESSSSIASSSLPVSFSTLSVTNMESTYTLPIVSQPLELDILESYVESGQASPSAPSGNADGQSEEHDEKWAVFRADIVPLFKRQHSHLPTEVFLSDCEDRDLLESRSRFHYPRLRRSPSCLSLSSLFNSSLAFSEPLLQSASSSLLASQPPMSSLSSLSSSMLSTAMSASSLLKPSIIA